MSACSRGVRAGELRPGGLALEQLHGLGEERAGPLGPPELCDDGAQSRESFPGGEEVGSCAEGSDGLLVHLLGLARVARPPCCGGGLGEDGCPFGVVDRQQLDRAPVARAGLPGVELKRPVTRHDEEASSGVRQMRDLVRRAGGAGELERLPVMVGEEIGVVGDALACHLLDPVGGAAVLRRALGARNLAIGDVADQGVPEDVLRLILYRGRPRPSHELLACELMEPFANVFRVAIAHRFERTGPEDLAEHGRVVEQRLPLRRDRVQARGDDALHRVGQREILGRAALAEHPHVLLGVERVATCPFQ